MTPRAGMRYSRKRTLAAANAAVSATMPPLVSTTGQSDEMAPYIIQSEPAARARRAARRQVRVPAQRVGWTVDVSALAHYYAFGARSDGKRDVCLHS
jgi:hypothetical protein